MTDLVTPGEIDGEVDNLAAGHAWAKAGSGAWIVDGADIANAYPALDETVLNGFAHTGSTGLDVDIAPGEAYVAGWLCRDRATTVTLPASSLTTVYLGWDASATLGSTQAPADSENVIVGLEGDFAAEDPGIPIWTFETDGSGVIGTEDHRLLNQPLWVDHDTGETHITTPLRTGQILGGLDIEGALTTTGDATVGGEPHFEGQRIDHDRTAGDSADYRVRIDGNPRHVMRVNDNAGTFSMFRYDSTGTYLNSYLSVDLDTGLVTFDEPVDITGELELTESGTRFAGSGREFPIAFYRDGSGGFHVRGLIDHANAQYSRSLGFFAGSGDDIPNAEISQSGDAYFGNLDASTLTEGGAPVPTADQDYEIRKNGTDGAGIINFKTQ